VSYLGALALTMVFGAVVFAMTGSLTLAGVTGLIGGYSYARSLRER